MLEIQQTQQQTKRRRQQSLASYLHEFDSLGFNSPLAAGDDAKAAFGLTDQSYNNNMLQQYLRAEKQQHE